jgi:Family of unknown function (DUF5947)
VPAPPPDLGSSRLRSLARGATDDTRPVTQEEHCDLCGEPIPREHRHLLDLETRELMCACRACSLLFDRGAAGGGHYRLVPERRLSLADFELPDPAWERLRIPVEMAFFFHSSKEGRVMAFYPSPMGPTESQLGLEAWDAIRDANPVLETLEPDVEALLVNRARGARRQWVVPIDECYRLVGVIRTRWRGLSGGSEVWKAIDGFFEDLERRCTPARTHRNGEGRTQAATASAAEGSGSGI